MVKGGRIESFTLIKSNEGIFDNLKLMGKLRESNGVPMRKGGMSDAVEMFSSSDFCFADFFSAHWHCMNSLSPILGVLNSPSRSLIF